jgi:FkbM family methyltransferase
MGTFRTGARHCLELLARSERARKRVISVGSIEYILQRRQVFQDFAIDLALDVGANTGQFAHDLRVFYKGDLISFEPVSAAFLRLASTASRDPRWKVYQFALGSQNSTQTINVYRRTEMSSLLKANAYCTGRYGESVATTGQEVVPVRRLDDVLDEVAPDHTRRRVFLKMDTQGYDLEVFKGLGNKLKHVVAIQSEVSLIPIYEGMPHWIDSILVYERAGFGVAGLFPVTVDGCRVIEYDCLMVRV